MIQKSSSLPVGMIDDVFKPSIQNLDNMVPNVDNIKPPQQQGHNNPWNQQQQQGHNNPWNQQQQPKFPPGNAVKPADDVAIPPGNAVKPADDVAIPPGNAVKPADDVAIPPGKPLTMAERIKEKLKQNPPQMPQIGQGPKPNQVQAQKLQMSNAEEVTFRKTLASGNERKTGVLQIEEMDDVAKQRLAERFRCGQGRGHVFSAYQSLYAGAVSRGTYKFQRLNQLMKGKSPLFDGAPLACNEQGAIFAHFAVTNSAGTNPGAIRSFFRVYEPGKYVGDSKNIIEVTEASNTNTRNFPKQYLYCGIASHTYVNGNINGYQPCTPGA
jgi:hypothetical protein